MTKSNNMKIEFDSKSENEAFARVAIAAFVSQLDPTIEELDDVKTAVSEAVTNSIIHGYEMGLGTVYLSCSINDNIVTIIVEDKGKGIDDVNRAMEPLYTSKPELERSGMGFTVMQTFMDNLIVESKLGEGTRLTMKREFKSCQ